MKWKQILNYRHWNIRTKFTLVVLGITLTVMLINSFLLYNMNSLTDEVGVIYESNVRLNELSRTLDKVQDYMTGYLNTKTIESMENYYRYAQELRNQIEELNDTVTSDSISMAETNTRHMLESYLKQTDNAIEAKRGRNVQRYRVAYEETVRLHGYITHAISRLNDERFDENAQSYVRLTGYLHSLELWCMVVFVMTGGIGVILVITLCNAITTPLRHLAKAAQQVTRGNYDVELSERSSGDEIGIVNDAFQTMVVSIQDNIVKLRENMEKEQEMKEKELLMDAQLKEAQLKYLQAQINPHFLFNTLNAGAQLAMMEGADRAYEYIQQVASFFRYNIRKDNDDVSLQEEIAMVDSYIYILNVRFAGDIGYEKDIDPELMNVRLPGMTLQPLVENCVSHGIRNITWDGVIRISARRVGKNVCISVSDNGMGMSQERIEEVLGEGDILAAEETDSNGIGMRNVRNRLELMYGRHDMMDILSEGYGQGTEVLLYIPWEE